LVWWDHAHPRDPSQIIPGFERAKLSAITIVRDGATVKLTRDGGAWSWDGLRADGGAVEQLIGALEFEKIERKVGRDPALAKQVGLDPSRLTVEAQGKKLALGGDAAGGRTVYALRDGELLILDHRLKDLVDVAPEKWRLMRPLLTDTGAIKTLQVGAVKLSHEGDRWLVDGTPAEPHAVDRLLDAADRARATSITKGSGGAGQEILVNGAVEATVAGACAKGTRILRRDGADLCFDEAALRPLFQTAKQLHEPRLYPLPLDAITDIDLREGEKRLQLHRESAMWRIVAPLEAAGPADDPSVRAWLDEIVTLSEEGGPQQLTVKTPDTTMTHAVKGQPLDPLRFHDRRVIDVDPDKLERVTVDGYTIVRQRHGNDPDTFEVDPPVPADDDDLRTLFETFAQLRVKTFDHEKRHASRTISGAGKQLHLTDCAGELDGLSFTLDEPTCQALSLPLGR
jgi:hypothetical protein